jgi:macrolide-specific efflux system membrane fusion protein
MHLRTLAVLLLVLVGVGAVGLVLFAPAAGSNATARFLTATAARTTVRDQVVATASISASATYGLGFGREPALVTSTAASSSGSSTAIVKNVAVKVGDKVTTGTALATVDPTDSAAQLATAQAGLDAAKATLADDQAAPTAATIASAQASIDQATQQLSQSKTSQADTKRQNDLTLARATKTWTDAMAAKATDKAAGYGTTRLAADQDVIDAARQSLRETQAQLTASTHQAANGVASAELALATAKSDYTTKTAKTTDNKLASDQAAVDSAQTTVATAKRTLDLSTIVSPVDGTVIAVNAVAGLAAPSGDAIQVAVLPMQVTAQFAEGDITRISAGQAATITVSAIKASLDGVVRQVTPTASSSGTSSVVTYAVTVTVTGEDARLTSGMSASVAVVISEAADVVAVPATALQGTAGDYSVRVLDAAGQVTARPVQVGLVTSSLAEIQNGIAEGDQVVTGTVAARQGTTTTTNAGGGGAFPVGGGGFPGGGRQP